MFYASLSLSSGTGLMGAQGTTMHNWEATRACIRRNVIIANLVLVFICPLCLCASYATLLNPFMPLSQLQLKVES